jgi:DNA-binding transcriptional ArsR family regulator
VSERASGRRSTVGERSEGSDRPDAEERLETDERAGGEEDGDAADEVLDLVGQHDTRRLLAHARREPLSARELADRCGLSLSTVYRRADALSERNLLDEQLQPDQEGNHYRTFETSVERISMIVEQGAFGVDVQYRRDLTDKFEAFWQDLAGEVAD